MPRERGQGVREPSNAKNALISPAFPLRIPLRLCAFAVQFPDKTHRSSTHRLKRRSRQIIRIQRLLIHP